MDEQVWSLQYDVQIRAGITGKDSTSRNLSVELTLGWNAVAVDREEKARKTRWRLLLDHRNGRRSFLDRTTKREVQCDLGRKGVESILSRLPTPEIHADGKTRPLRIGEHDHECRYVTFDSGDLIVEVWTARLEGVSGASVRLAWAILTGHQLPPADSSYGVPVEITVRRREDLSQTGQSHACEENPFGRRSGPVDRFESAAPSAGTDPPPYGRPAPQADSKGSRDPGCIAFRRSRFRSGFCVAASPGDARSDP